MPAARSAMLLRSIARGLGAAGASADISALLGLRVSELQRKASAAGATPEAIDEALDAADPKQALAGLVERVRGESGNTAAAVVRALSADPREMPAEQVEACCALWAQESGDFVPAERAGDFLCRPKGTKAILAQRQLHNSMPDDARYSLERWHFILAQRGSGESSPCVCLALCRSFVRRALGRRTPKSFGWPLNLLCLCGVVCDGNTRRRGYGSAVVSAAFKRLDELQARQVSAVLFSTNLVAHPENEEFYTRLGCKKVTNHFINSSDHMDNTHRSILAGGARAPEGDTPFVYMNWKAGGRWEQGATIDILGRGW